MFRIGNKSICLLFVVFGIIIFSTAWIIRGYLDVHYNLLVTINERTSNIESGIRKQINYFVNNKSNMQAANLQNSIDNLVKEKSNVQTFNQQYSPNVYTPNSPFLELQNMEKHFKNNLFLGNIREKKSFVVMGVPTVYRNKGYYIIDTLFSLVTNLNKKDWDKVVIVVFVSDFKQDYLKKVIDDIKLNFSEEVSAGLIQVVQPSASFYPKMENIPSLFGDSTARIIWRSKQSLDYSFLFYYCADLAQFYIQLEDDVIAVENYLQQISEFIRTTENWAILEFGARGFIGMTYRSKHLKFLSKFVRFAYWALPIDWTFRYFNDMFLYGNSNKTKSPIFKHVGQFSSLDGQIRKLEDINDYPEQIGIHVYQSKEGNPKAKIKTSMIDIVQPHEISNPYSKSGLFWSSKVQVGDTINIIFENMTKISQLIITSGNSQHPGDILHNSELLASKDNSCATFTSVKTFFNSNTIKYTFDATSSLVKCLQLKILTIGQDVQNRPHWLIISEIAVLV